jgi:hypothetical protein
MSQTLTIRLTDELLAWLKEKSRRTGVALGRLARAARERQVQGRKAETASPCRRNLRRTRRPVLPKRAFPVHEGNLLSGRQVAFARSNDERHRSAFDVAKGITEPRLTCEAVLGRGRLSHGIDPYVLAVIDAGLLRLAFDCSRNLVELRELTRRTPIATGFGRLCLIRKE